MPENMEEKDMKISGKKFAIMVTLFALLLGTMYMPLKAEAKNSYWLSGVSKAAGGAMKMYYKGNTNTISVKGKVRKSTSPKKVYEAAEKEYSCSLKVAANCKVVLVEAENVQTTSYQKWVKDNGYQAGDKIRFIAVTLKVQGKKIVKISFSA